MVGKQGLEPYPPAPKAGALTLTLHPANLFPSPGAVGTRADPLLGQTHGSGGDERTRTAGLRIAKPTLFQAELHPQRPPRAARRRPGGGGSASQRAWSGHTPFPPGWSALFGVHAVQLSIGVHVHP